MSGTRARFTRSEISPRRVAALGAATLLAVLGSWVGTASLAGASSGGHTIGSAVALDIGVANAGGGGVRDFWLVNLTGGDVVDVATTQPALHTTTPVSYLYKLLPPGTSDANLAGQTAADQAITPPGSTTSTVTLQAPYSATFVLLVCETTNNTCSGGFGVNPMQAYTITPTLEGGGTPAGVGALEVRAGSTVGAAAALNIGARQSGGGNARDIWLISLTGGDVVEFATTQTPRVNGTTPVSYLYQLLPPDTTDQNSDRAAAVQTVTPAGSTTSTVSFQVPYSGTFILSVCETVASTTCSGGFGISPMKPYTFTPSLVGGGVPAAVGAREVRAGSTVGSAALLNLGAFQAGGGGSQDLWKVSLTGGDVVQIATTQPPKRNGTTPVSYYYRLYAPDTTDLNLDRSPVDKALTPVGSTTSTVSLRAPSSGTFVLLVCETVGPVCSGGFGVAPMQPYTFTPSLIAGSNFTGLTPVRLFDTRSGQPQGAIVVAQQRVGGANVLRVKIAGTGGVPVTGAGAVSLNVTVANPVGAGYVTVFPCGTQPLASNLNYTAGQIVPNAVIAPLSAAGEVCIYSSVDTDVIADVNGWFATGAGFTGVDPIRVFDTRHDQPQGAVAVTQQLVGGANVLRVKIAGTGGVPVTGAGAVSLNVTVANPVGAGYVTVFPCGTQPLASNLNYTAGQIVPNAVIAPLSAAGEVCFYSSVDTDVIADVNGWFATGAGFTGVDPIRVFDTRHDQPQGAVAVTQQLVGGANVLRVKIAGTGGVPVTGAGAVSLNVTVANPVGAGYVTVFPCGTQPLASNLNYTAGQIVPNAVIAPLSAAGEVCIYSSVDTDVIADVNGWFAASAS